VLNIDLLNETLGSETETLDYQSEAKTFLLFPETATFLKYISRLSRDRDYFSDGYAVAPLAKQKRRATNIATGSSSLKYIFFHYMLALGN